MTSTASLTEPPVVAARRRSPMTATLQRYLRNRLALTGLAIIAGILLVSLLGPVLLGRDPLRIDLHARFLPPLADRHLFGTDALGRDIATRLFVAGRVSLAVAFFAMLMSIVLGSGIGLVAGYVGGMLGTGLMRLVDSFLCFPSIFLLLTLSAFIGTTPAMITALIGATSWMEIARIVTAETRSLREREFVLAARMVGQSTWWIITRELLPNVTAPITVAATLTVARAILAEAYISFLGYGIQPPAPSWGNMLNGAQQYLATAPWIAIFPGLMIALVVTAFNLVGDGLRQAFDVRAAR